MAALAIAVAGAGAAKLAVTSGALAASYFGVSTIGLGWAAGSVVGSMLFGPQGQKLEGPRLQDVSVQGSAYGQFIPITYGSMRVAGNIIWATDIVERSKRKKVGGKGGGSSKVTTYTYFANFASMLCEGEIDSVQRIWADGRLIYDTSINNTGITGASSRIRIYKGTEDQLPDPFIQARMGAANTPAYRGRAYVVFENLALEEFGNRIPNMTFEVIRGNEVIPNITYYDRDSEILPSIVNFSGHQSVDLDSRICWWVGTQTIGGITYNRLNATNFDTGALFYEQLFERESFIIFGSVGFNSFRQYSGTGNTSSCVYVPTTEEIWIAGTSLSVSHYVHNAFTGNKLFSISKGWNTPFEYFAYDKFADLVIGHTNSGTVRAIVYFPITKSNISGTLTVIPSVNADSVVAFSKLELGVDTSGRPILSSHMWAGARATTANIRIRRMTVEYPEVNQIPNPITFVNMFYDEVRDLMIIINSRSSPNEILIRAYKTTGLFEKVLENTITGFISLGSCFHSVNTDQYVLCQSTVAGTSIYYIDPDTLTLNFIYEGGPGTTFNGVTANPIIDIDRGFALGGTGAVNQPKRFARVPLQKRTNDDPVRLGDIVDDISERAGLEQSQIDTSTMNESVKGYVITRQAPARAALEPLLTAYFYNSTESST